MIFRITAPIPPSDNSLYPQAVRRVRGGGYVPVNRRILSKEGKAWAGAFMLILAAGGCPRFPKERRGKTRPVFSLSGELFLPKSEFYRGDVSNRWKLLTDTVSEFCGIDDRYCISFGPFRKKVIATGGASVQIEVEFFESLRDFCERVDGCC